ncbi:ATP-dependent helicase hrpA [Serinicoccus hydrothermalis]|uniref:ATP-dependent helicase hrpA n=1 Tax=Serinicoccus hydrothermalis TaxID=1758689 RepID=A0A1B1NA57_9MICO|nr:ATP-dependent RNA helicase HrpA [Serinicoccus hydrothermalis]ANS78306.1 ATP-dependent helicase hrpA [Serinicoccus hydrothermalis]
MPGPDRRDRKDGTGRRRGRRGQSRSPRGTDAAAAAAARREAQPKPGSLHYPPELPVSERREDLLRAVADHQVVVVAGETGSGKTTQLPKICLELGRGVEGMIGHTQPRRIAARSVAERVSEELGAELGTVVGYQVRFTDVSRADTLVKVMTDGILLSELQRDRDLRRYDTLIIDEAHERSLNIDFILGYLRRLLPRRPDLKVIITSATIDVERFAAFFADEQGRPAPVIEVSGRTYPVEVRYRPLTREEPGRRGGADAEPREVEIDQVTGVVEAVEELWTEDTGRDGLGEDVLVFCSGEREIRDVCDALGGLDLPGTEVLPLYGRLSAAEQHRVFSRHTGRRIVVSTNVAETSLTVPGIRYVVDTGTARISRYSQRLKVQRLPIEPISQASANQRAGRCGRLADGIAIRLYSEEDFAGRPEFTDPEILRTNLASVILQMTNLGLGEIEKFGFLEPPDSRQVADGVRLLTELQAIDPKAPAHLPRKRLTPYGRAIVGLPVDPRLARMLIEAERQGALKEVLVVVAALSMQDVRERPSDRQQQADQAHARFRRTGGAQGPPNPHRPAPDDKGDKDVVDSDFLVILNLWRYLQRQQKQLSGSAFRRMCKAEFLHYLRVREWQDLHTQLRRAVKQLGMELNQHPANSDQVHSSLLTGLLSNVGMWEREARAYLGARNARFVIQPGSVLHRKNPDWVMSAELVETTRLWARTNAVIDPAEVERAAAHLVKRSYSEPRWSRSAGSAVADERVTLYGIPLVAGRAVPLGRIDPETARDLFIRQGLVEEDWETRHEFFHANRRLVRELGQLEERARRRDILVDDETLVEFYSARIPAEVVSGTHFDTWWKTARREDPQLLTFTEDLLVGDAGDRVSGLTDDFPTQWRQGELTFGLTYQFEPGADADGVTAHLPVEVLNQVQEDGFDWLVPGMHEELVTALVKALPKDVRRNFVPAPDHARAALRGMREAGVVGRVPVREALADELTGRGLARVDPGDMAWERVPDHLRMTFRVERAARPGKGRNRRRGRAEVLGEGKDLASLQEELAPAVRSSMAAAASGVERTGLTAWPADLDPLPETFSRQVGPREVQGYPALVDTGDAVDVRVLATRSEADRETRRGVRRLLLLGTTPPWKRLLALLSNQQKLSLGHNPHGSVPALLEDALAAAVDSVVAEQPGATVRTPSQFEAALVGVRQQTVPRVLEIVESLVPILDTAREVSLRLQRLDAPAAADLATDLRRQLDALVRPGFVTDVGYARLPRMVVWLRGMAERLDKGVEDLNRDRQRREDVGVVESELASFLDGLPPHRRGDPDVRDVVWSLQELRVSLFAQRLGTPAPVSPKRIYAAMDRAEAAG